MVWFGRYICPTKPKLIYRRGWAKEKVGMGAELGVTIRPPLQRAPMKRWVGNAQHLLYRRAESRDAAMRR